MRMKKLTKFLQSVFLLALISSNANAESLNYNYSAGQGLDISFDKLGTVKLKTDIECGYMRDGALYASFGFEGQNFRCSKTVFELEGESEKDSIGGNWVFKVSVAPIYDSIKSENRETKIYANDSQNRPIDGNNRYFDWYKNQGSRLYYLGDTALFEAFVGYQYDIHLIKAGRMKTIIGFDDHELFFGDDAKFAPMGYWLSKDLLSGVSYNLHYNIIEADVAFYSGSNPNKGYANYLDRPESPNLKSNNTPIYAGRIKLHTGDYLGENIEGHIFASYLRNMTGSTYEDVIGDGKRNASVMAYGAKITARYDQNLISSTSIFGQYTEFESGLRSKGSQNDGHPRFKDIKQKGFFAGAEVGVMSDSLKLGAAYEKMDRFDYNIFAFENFASNSSLLKAKQKSWIFNAKYEINSIVSMVASYHKITNPAEYVSNILDTRKTDRVKLVLNVKL